MAATVTDPTIGTVVDGRYHVLSRIARGGMATVYLAQDRRLDRQVALKMMHPHLADGSDVVARFRREARAAARLSHPGVVGVYDQGMEGETSYLTMEFVDGQTLRRKLTTSGALSLGTALDILESVLDALAAAHRAGLVHRDIKPENVLIAGDGTVKVADFGLARAVTEATMSTTGALLGTVAYLSPEIVTAGSADLRSDVYAAGVMFYEMLTGHQPFRGETPIQIAYQHVHERVPAASEEIDWLPLEVDEFIAALTARNPDDRPHSADAALSYLRKIRPQFDSRMLALRADVAPDEVAQIVDEVTEDSERAGATVQVGGPARTVALPIGAVTPVDQAQQPADPHRRLRTRRITVLASISLLLAIGATGVWWYLSMGPGSYTTVPDVTGNAQSTAESIIQDAELAPQAELDYSDDVPAGHVIGTSPQAGEAIKLGETVTILVSQGILLVTVPQVAGMAEADATAALLAAGITGEIVVERPWNADVPAGQVLGTEPTVDTSVAHNSPITMWVSQGREPIEIPDVTGVAVEDAEQLLLDAGAEPQVDGEEYSDTVPAGLVLRQDVTGAGLRGDLVTLVVSKGPELIEVPDVFGTQFEQARAQLEELGFVVERENLLGGLFGTVHNQSEEPGTMIPRGTVIVLRVV
ncbi:MAG: Stk1 family PASTA domain-containing Ser/Thr kinase [Beutenbergiaceae bacterium]